MPEPILLQRKIARLSAVPVQRAAAILQMNRRSVYRLTKTNKLEMVRRHGRIWVTVRSVKRYLETHQYSPTKDFNLLEES